MRNQFLPLLVGVALGAVPLVSSPARADSEDVLQWLPLPATIVVRTLLNQDLPDLAPTSPAVEPTPDEAVVDVQVEVAPPVVVEFRYDDAEPMTAEPVGLNVQTMVPSLPPVNVDEATDVQMVELAAEVRPLDVVFGPTVDPFFGSVLQLLGARLEQPVIPADAIGPPTTPQYVDGEPMLADPTGGKVTPIASLPRIVDGNLLDFQTVDAGVEPGRAVLLTEGRALLLQNLEWRDDLALFQLPVLRLKQPTIARVFLARPDGVVSDYVDFLLIPSQR